MKIHPILPKIFLACILLLGSWLRLEGVITNSFAFTYDVGRDMLALHEMATSWRIPLIGQTTGLPGLFYGPWWYYLLFPAYLISFGDPQGIAFFMALIGIAVIALGYFVGKKIGGEVLGLLFASFLAFSPTMIGLSAQIWNPNTAPLFVLLCLYCMYRLFSLQKKKIVWKEYFFIGILLGFILDAEVVFGTLFSAGIVLPLLLLLRSKVSIRQYGYLVLGLLIMLSPRILFEVRHHFLMTNTILSFITQIISSPRGGSTSFLLADRAVVLSKLWSETVTNNNSVLGRLLLLTSAAVIIIFRKHLSEEKKLFILQLAIIVLVFLLGLSIFPGDIWGHYVVALPVVYLLLLSFAIQLFYVGIPSSKYLLLLGVVGLLLLNIDPGKVMENIKNPYWDGDASLYRNQKAVVDYVYQQAGKEQFKYTVYTPPVHDYPYQYLFLWYGQKKYSYLPAKDKAPLFFLILEPDYQNPQRLTDWLKIRDGDGVTIDTKTLSGGITVQKRVHSL